MAIDQMITWLKVSLWITCIITTSFPVLYGLGNRWWTTRAGTATLLMSTSLAVAWDTTLVFSLYWRPSITVAFWSEVAVHALTSVAGVWLLYALWYNRRHGEIVTVRREKQHVEPS
jgi:hypothetical protein